MMRKTSGITKKRNGMAALPTEKHPRLSRAEDGWRPAPEKPEKQSAPESF